jgi:acetylcholinesterase
MIAAQYLPQYLSTGIVPNISTTDTLSGDFGLGRDPRENEDCLFLDVFAPRSIYKRAGQGCRAPVLVWIHGIDTTISCL